MSDAPSDIPVLTAARLSPLYTASLAARFTLLDRLHQTDPATFERLAPTVRAVAASGDSAVPGELIAWAWATTASTCRPRWPAAWW